MGCKGVDIIRTCKHDGITNVISFTEAIQSDITILQLRAYKETSNYTSENDPFRTNQSISDLQHIIARIDALEAAEDIYGTALSQLETDTNAHEERIQNSTHETIKIIDGLKANLTSQGAILIALNEIVTQLKAPLNDQNNSLNTDYSLLFQLEADINSSQAVIQKYSYRIKELESNKTADRASILRLTMEIANLGANLTSINTIVKAQSDTLVFMNATLMQIGIGSRNQSNTSAQAYMDRLLVQLETGLEDRLLQIESDIETNRRSVEEHTDKIKLVEANLTSELDKSANLSSNVANFVFEIEAIKYTIQNNRVGLIDISDKIELLNETLTDYLGVTQYLSSNIETMKASIQNNTRDIVSSVMNLKELDNTTSDSISRLDTGLTDVIGKHFVHSIGKRRNGYLQSTVTSQNT